MVALDEAVTDTGFAGNRNARLAESGDVPVNGADADLEVVREVLRAHQTAPLQMHHHGHESIDSIHGVLLAQLARNYRLFGLLRVQPPPSALMSWTAAT